MENITVNANEMANKLLSALVTDIAKAVLVELRPMIAEITDARLGELEMKVSTLEDNVQEVAETAAQEAVENFDFEDAVRDVLRGVSVSLDV